MLQNIPPRAPETKQRMTSLQLKLFVEFERRHYKHGKIDALFCFLLLCQKRPPVITAADELSLGELGFPTATPASMQEQAVKRSDSKRGNYILSLPNTFNVY